MRRSLRNQMARALLEAWDDTPDLRFAFETADVVLAAIFAGGYTLVRVL